MKDESSHKPVSQAPMHLSWHRLMDEHDRLLIWSHIEAGKTQQVSVARTLWELGNDPSLRFLVLSNTKNQARKVASQIKALVELSDELKDVFPNLKPGEPWGEYAFNIERDTYAKDYSVQTSGVHGNILGSRLDRIIGDDMLDPENTRTQDQRKNLIEWWPTATGRVIDGGRIRIVGNAFHPQDLLHHLARQTMIWKAFRYPVVDPLTGHSRWPERWPLERVMQRMDELGPLESARQLMCEARDDAASRFKKEHIDLALALGEGTSLASALTVVPRGYRTFTGVDLAVQQKDTADLTVLFSIAVDPFGVRSVLNIESGRWTGPEIVRRIRDAHVRYQSIVVVENNAAQDFIVQFTRQMPGPAVPMIPYTTGRSKAHPEFGVESIATEMANGKWKIPNIGGRTHPEVRAWIDDMLFYSPDAHTGDRLMGCFLAREGVRLGDKKPEGITGPEFTRR